MKLHLVRKFDAAHILGNKNKPEEWNNDTYGKCFNLHGHTFTVEVTIEGQPNPDNGMIVNFNEIKKLIDSLDHSFINERVKLPTAENLVKYFLDNLRLIGAFDKITVRVWESPTAWVEDEWTVE